MKRKRINDESFCRLTWSTGTAGSYDGTSKKSHAAGFFEETKANPFVQTIATNWNEFKELLMTPCDEVRTKDGSYFIRGHSDTGSHCDTGIKLVDYVVIDGDHGKESSAASDLKLVCEILKAADLAFVGHTSHSFFNGFEKDGTPKEHRWRVVLPTLDSTTWLEQLNYVLVLINENKGDVAWNSEMTKRSQPWFLPRLHEAGARFEAYSHDGYYLDASTTVSIDDIPEKYRDLITEAKATDSRNNRPLKQRRREWDYKQVQNRMEYGESNFDPDSVRPLLTRIAPKNKDEKEQRAAEKEEPDLIFVVCPFADLHSDDDAVAKYFKPDPENYDQGGFRCWHDHKGQGHKKLKHVINLFDLAVPDEIEAKVVSKRHKKTVVL